MKLKKILIGSLLVLQAGALVACHEQKCENPANVDGVKWYHISDEKRALYLEVYNLAVERITQQVREQDLQKGEWGIILDIDETTLDNSWAEYENYKTYEFSEKEYAKAKAKALPGVKKLVDTVHELGGYVSFVSNRTGNDKAIFDGTVKNMQNEGVYYDQIILSNVNDDQPHNKNPRFEAVQSGVYNANIIGTNELPAHKVIAYFGDNIQDFPNMTQKEMRDQDDKAYSDFGTKYFILPNPMYGSWM